MQNARFSLVLGAQLDSLSPPWYTAGMNYMKEILGKHYLEPAQWEAKNAKANEAFKARLEGLPVAQAKAICLRFKADADMAATSSGRIAAAYLANIT